MKPPLQTQVDKAAAGTGLLFQGAYSTLVGQQLVRDPAVRWKMRVGGILPSFLWDDKLPGTRSPFSVILRAQRSSPQSTTIALVTFSVPRPPLPILFDFKASCFSDKSTSRPPESALSRPCLCFRTVLVANVQPLLASSALFSTLDGQQTVSVGIRASSAPLLVLDPAAGIPLRWSD
ncbi:uncharacterized protein FOMMEDRAFT_147701 [Fomitiporia mediterranea MF3/22]|uniref:uncharacterized protein n=1 Tax=Fomitiporia mediterranea (strain MF3/22) TaxID=694068 RepID=UPI0004407DF3|nr:uncharacterized protein FOMMEDRAFT_147701 [Fomitiporia mediterranea MF3/22]EJD01044.1 hypothetical protein FOMMEDRAFT_147701 [Fomitiporia mediterranea MF3/22]